MPHVVFGSYQRWLATQGGKAHSLIAPGSDEYVIDGWLITQDFLHHRRAPGNTCLSALQFGKVGTPDEPLNDSKGCGGIMRIAPVGPVCNDPFGDGCDLAALTHGHPTGYLAAGAFALIVKALFRGAPLSEAIDAALAELRRHAGHEETTRAIKRAVTAAETQPPTPETVEELGEGWIAEEALAIALFCALTAPDFESGIVLAANHSGDSDSTASLTGQLLGVPYGIQGIPRHFLEELEGRRVIEQVADDLVRHFVPPSQSELDAGTFYDEEDVDRYPTY